MTKIRKKYSDEDKLHFVRLYQESGMSKNSFCRRYEICNHTLLNAWLKKFAPNQKDVYLSLETDLTDMANRSKEDFKDENAQLKKRIKELEKALAFSKLETEARDLMITRAEEYFNISIRKKPGPNSNGSGQPTQLKDCVGLPTVWPLPSGLLPV